MTESLNKRNDNHQERVEVVEDMKQKDSSVDGLQSGPVHFKEVALKSKGQIVGVFGDKCRGIHYSLCLLPQQTSLRKRFSS